MKTIFIRRRAGRRPLAPPDLDRRLRRSLHSVATAMPESPAASERPATARKPRRTRRRVALAMAALVIPLTAAGFLLGPEYVDQIPPKNPLLSGDAHGERYWLIPGRVVDDCGQPLSAVELVVEDQNAVGKEWNTVGIAYGDPIIREADHTTCGVDESAWLADPTRFVWGRVDIADDRIYLVAMHPNVRSIKVVTAAGTQTIATVPTPARPDGPRYAAFDVPERSTSIIATLLDATGQPIPGGERDMAKRS
ncbi:hypothetical protein ONA91_20940 [Micromonospora sp. DR5-3]|uniref:hypothetical protein n=1 Tax=unclassified Micromonospora TaxID=2617518 RepID=UPI0011D56115|nr:MULTISPECIES: hypothetical protein [unclassified Micromonospora]MCW3816917.1 hypothetical protein [Micromonospora sp. DR5-3]TYC23415.1 hypothetical protein FXF52_15585 [Micromonospora sp. MP36]